MSHGDKNAIKAEVEDTLPLNSSGIVALFEEQWAGEIDKALPQASKVTKEQVDAGSAAEVKTAADEDRPADDRPPKPRPCEFNRAKRPRPTLEGRNCHDRFDI